MHAVFLFYKLKNDNKKATGLPLLLLLFCFQNKIEADRNYLNLRLRAASDFFLRLTLGFS
jgi:hypothetical protein